MTSRLHLNGAELLAERSGVLLWPEARALIVADLHLEKAAALNRRGGRLPPYDSLATLERLEAAVTFHDPRLVVSLGDAFHDRVGAADPGETIRRVIERLAEGRRWIWITGNHDPEAPAGLPGESHAALPLGPLVFRHAAEPGETGGAGEVSGHYHPKATVRVRGKRLSGRCFIEDGQRLVLPAFGAFTGGLNVLDPAILGLFAAPLRAHLIGRRSVYAYPGHALVA